MKKDQQVYTILFDGTASDHKATRPNPLNTSHTISRRHSVKDYEEVTNSMSLLKEKEG